MKKLLLTALAGLCLSPAAVAADARVDFTLQAVQDLRERARFPEWSQPVAAGHADPLAEQRRPTRQALAGPQGAAPTLTVWASTISARPGEAVDLHAQLSALAPDTADVATLLRANRRIAASSVTAELTGETLGALGQVAYRDDGVAPDARAADGIYSARVVLPADRAPALGRADSVAVRVRAVLANGEERVAVGGFQFSRPGAILTGRYRDLVRDGNLVLAAEAEVLAPGRYHLSGTLADLAGAPVATAQAARQLQPGKQWIELSYYGLIFHERGALGRLRLASVALTTTGAMPNALGPVVRNAHLTQALNPAALTRQPFGNPDLLETARRLEATLPVAP